MTPPMPEFGEFIDKPLKTREERAAAAALPIQDRQRIVERLSTATPHSKAIQKALKSFHMPVEGGRHGVGRICGLIGPSRTGKSWALAKYIQGLGRMDRTDAVVPRAIYVEASEGGSGRDFAELAYRRLGLGDAPRRAAKWLLDAVMEEVVAYGIELVVIDDVQFVLTNRVGGTAAAVQGFLKNLANRQTCNVVLAGDQTVEDVIRSVPHLEGRGGFPVEHVRPYAWSTAGGTGDFGMLLDRIDNRLPFLLPSMLSLPSTAAHLHRLSGGIIGRVMNIVGAAAFAAMGDGASAVGVDHLRAAAQRTMRLGDPYQPFETDPAAPAPKKAAPEPTQGAEPTLTKRPPRRRAA